MQRSFFKSVTRRVSRFASAAVLAGSLLFGGCANASTHVTSASAAQQTPVRADVIVVYPFTGSADQVQLDSGMAQRLKTQMSGSSAEAEQMKAATQASEQVADEIVKRLQAMGLNAQRANSTTATAQNAVFVEGSFESLDAGSRRRRMLIGFGAGKSKVSASVALIYQQAPGEAVTLRTFSADADSGKAPGIAVTAGVGAAADRAATAVVTGTGIHGVSEAHHDTLSADTKRMADAIAKQIASAVTGSANVAQNAN